MLVNVIKTYKTNSLSGLYINHDMISSIIKDLDPEVFNVEEIGRSEENRPVYRVKFGKGSVKVLLWTQMHGDETTATKSVLDVFSIVNSRKVTNVNLEFLEHLTIYVIPMLNPDGAERFTRTNAHDFDLNRDAKQLKYSESQILYNQVKTLKPDFAFNLHDQTSFYNIHGTAKPASISFLAPAYNEEKSVNESRSKAMSVIVAMQQTLSKHIQGHIGRYNDTYCDSCFGDTIQNLGVPTILIECGYYQGDFFREYIRDLHTLALFTAFETITRTQLPDYKPYFDIPMNDKCFYDIKFHNILYNSDISTIGVRYKTVYKDGRIVRIVDPEEKIIEKDDLNKYYFHQEIDAKGEDFNTFLMMKI